MRSEDSLSSLDSPLLNAWEIEEKTERYVSRIFGEVYREVGGFFFFVVWVEAEMMLAKSTGECPRATVRIRISST